MYLAAQDKQPTIANCKALDNRPKMLVIDWIAFPYGNFQVVANFSQGYGILCKAMTTLHDGCVVVVQIVKLYSTSEC